jgi:hypothetical protein
MAPPRAEIGKHQIGQGAQPLHLVPQLGLGAGKVTSSANLPLSRSAARERSSLMIARAGISHIVV